MERTTFMKPLWRGTARHGTAGRGKGVNDAQHTRDDRMKYAFTLKGETPILFHADSVERADELTAWRKDPDNAGKSTAGDDRSPAWTWQAYLYSDGNNIAIPQETIMAALRFSGAKIPKKGTTTYKRESQSLLLISSEFCSFEGPEGPVSMAAIHKVKELSFADQAKAVKRLGFSLYVKRASVSSSKHVRVRPRFEDWTVRGVIEILDPEITPETLKRMFEIAGSRAGICDWRPSSPRSPGPFGKFTAELKPAK